MSAQKPRRQSHLKAAVSDVTSEEQPTLPSHSPVGVSVITCKSPIDGSTLGTVAVDDPNAVRRAIARAREAQIGWARTDFGTRRAVLRRIQDHLLANIDTVVEAVVRDAGKTRENALIGEIWTVLEKLRWTTRSGEKYLQPETVSSGLLMHKRARLEYHPLGVMGAILPWNYPLQNIMNPIIPALMAGNAIVVKPSEWVAWSAPGFVDIVKNALAAEGQSPELVQLVQGDAETGKALITGGIDGLVFIGSVPNGRRILATAAEALVPVVLELGGKDPFIVCDDADLEQAAHAAMVGCFVNAGQNCVASERLLVMDGVYDQFAAKMQLMTDGLRQGDPLAQGGHVDVGAMVTPIQLELVESLVASAVAEGARILSGGKAIRTASGGTYYAPTVLADVRPDMTIMNEEVFGPVMLLCRVRDEHEAIAIANGVPFGLSSSVFSRDHTRARRIMDRLHAGMSAMNEFGGATYMAQDLTFGGVKHSGFGRMNGRDGLRACCNVKATLEDRFPIHFPNKVYPVGAGDYGQMSDVLKLLYGRGVVGRMDALKALATRLFK